MTGLCLLVLVGVASNPRTDKHLDAISQHSGRRARLAYAGEDFNTAVLYRDHFVWSEIRFDGHNTIGAFGFVWVLD